MDPTMADHSDLEHAVRALLQTDRPLTDVQRLRGASKKGVYRLTLGPHRLIAYLWHPSQDYWPENGHSHDLADPFSHSSGAHLFAAAHRALADLGIAVPDLLALDTSKEHHRADIALVQDINGPTLEELLSQHSPRTVTPVLDRLGQDLRTMHAHHGPTFGKVAHVNTGGQPTHPTCEATILTRALQDLDEAAARDERARADHARLHHTLHTLAERITPRSQHALIHGELGPDHVLVTDEGTPLLINIEGLMFFDAEWEHVFLRLRFGDHYPRLATVALDPARTDLYTLALHLSLVAVPLRLLDGPFPGRDFMLAIVEHNLGCALRTSA